MEHELAPQEADDDIDRDRLRTDLKERNWTVTRLAREINCSQSFCSQVLNGHERPGRKFLKGLAKAGFDVGALLAEARPTGGRHGA